MSDISLDEDLVVLEGLDFDVVCDIWTPACDKKATWLVTSRCCKSEWYTCDEHRNSKLEFLKRTSDVKCNRCGYGFKPGQTINYDWAKL